MAHVDKDPDAGHYRADSAPIYKELHETAEFAELRKKYRGWAIPATVAFLVWYLLYVVLSNWAPGLMGIKVIGNINIALVLGLLQFVTTFGIAYLYAKHSSKALDPLATSLGERYAREAGQ
ncbi:DUF485 domain-containing protein [Nocardioides sp. CFH 31398]|uniref:DUF485 domain-containing protein n=1 Tax=Nocardioides sp. CFH 31398 TaxID=2919579 RepID=UPI001F050F54|nr:DUF485 domain-containing protein [Nocardioides sp. CFH 31398]MCH1867779.1 DUF485 domain-containing protein [Nocardioides sp. CFH 31398]